MQIAKCKLQKEASPWPHRWALLLACATFPLLWVGGLVTTTDAGMAVPDWPTTFGYNLFLYPWQTWLSGPWDLFVEHGHRLLAAAVGMITIGLLLVLWRTDQRRWMRWLGVAALALVIFQGVLGGLRVLFNERVLAMLHGCTGPLFFALAVAMVAFTSARWRAGTTQRSSATDSFAGAGQVRLLAVVTCVLVYLQIVMGAVLRHVPVAAEPATFALAVRFHLLMAGILAMHVLWLAWAAQRHARRIRPLAGLAWLIVGLLVVQLVLGAATWIVKYSVPYWADAWTGWIPLGLLAIRDGGWLQTHIITAHVAVGSLLLAASLVAVLYSLRLLPTAQGLATTPATRSQTLEAVV